MSGVQIGHTYQQREGSRVVHITDITPGAPGFVRFDVIYGSQPQYRSIAVPQFLEEYVEINPRQTAEPDS